MDNMLDYQCNVAVSISRFSRLSDEKTLTKVSSLYDLVIGGMLNLSLLSHLSNRVAQSVGHLSRKSGVLGSIPGLATYFRFSFRFFKKGSCQLLAKVCA